MVKPGDIIEINCVKFVLLEDLTSERGSDERHDLFLLALNPEGLSKFGYHNNYAKSELRHRVTMWYKDHFGDTAFLNNFRPRTIDLTTMDGHGRYGELEVLAAPLTMDEARKHANIIPNCDDDYWLAAGWGGPEHSGSEGALYVSTNGSWRFGACSKEHGIRPALIYSCFIGSQQNPDLGAFSDEALLKELWIRNKEDKRRGTYG